MKVFFDTNVIISAFITHGHASEVFEHCLSIHKCYTSDQVLAELEKNLRKKFGYSDSETKKVMDFTKENLVIIKNYKKNTVSICMDPDDDNILIAAVSIGADCIMTGDKDLKVLKNYKGINIISPKSFWELEKIFMKMN
ncbi:MAG: putative toxin-antitoxin system toxin component, PIN family [Candidatus Humimicrobiaceae bacterium]